MKKFQKRFLDMAEKLGMSGKLSEGKLSAAEQKKIFSEYKELFGVSFHEDRDLNEDEDVELQASADVELTEDQQLEISALLSIPAENTPKTTSGALKAMVKNAKELSSVVTKLKNDPDKPSPEKTSITSNAQKMAYVLGHTPHTDTHLFGIENEMFSLKKHHNQLFLSRKASDRITARDKKALLADFDKYSESVSERFQKLEAKNMLGLLNYNKMIAGESQINYTDLMDTAGEYIVRRTDLIFAFLRTLPSVTSIFPVVSNVQNKEIASTVQFGELSQSYREGRIFKGNAKFAAEIRYVIDVMFKFQFSDMIALEKQYIGYLNTSGSSVIKWTFIEWIIVNFAQQLMNEQNIRRIEGYRTNPQDVVSNPSKLAADGIFRAIERSEEEFKVLPFEDLKGYDEESMLDYVTSIFEKVVAILPTYEGYRVYANLKHKTWYSSLYATKYKTSTGVIVPSEQLPDLHPDKIIWIPNMSMFNYKMFITQPGNVQLLEDRPGEMLAFRFSEELESVIAMSRWKEGAALAVAGVKYKTKDDLIASNRVNQYIFTNFPASDLVLGEMISFAENNLFLVSGETTADTSVSSYPSDRVIKLVAKDTTVKVLKSGAFSKINSDFVPAKSGDYIKIYAELQDETDTDIDGKPFTITTPTGKFLELERKVSQD